METHPTPTPIHMSLERRLANGPTVGGHQEIPVGHLDNDYKRENIDAPSIISINVKQQREERQDP